MYTGLKTHFSKIQFGSQLRGKKQDSRLIVDREHLFNLVNNDSKQLSAVATQQVCNIMWFINIQQNHWDLNLQEIKYFSKVRVQQEQSRLVGLLYNSYLPRYERNKHCSKKINPVVQQIKLSWNKSAPSTHCFCLLLISASFFLLFNQ